MSSKALLIVEGEGREDVLFKKMRDVFSLGIEIVPFCGNVSMLYDEMKKLDFVGNIQDILKGRIDPEDPQKDAKVKILEDTYTDIYFVFDFDPQHSIKCLDGESLDDAMRRNASRVWQKAMAMAKVMDDSTDPMKGKLYLNFPGIESYRDADDFFDAGYATKSVLIKNLCKYFGGVGYKCIAGSAALANKKRLSDYTSDDFSNLAMMNVFKLRYMSENAWGSMSYDDYRNASEQSNVLDLQQKLMISSLSVWVLNTSLFFVFDYKGRAFYETVLCTGTVNESKK